ncbi:putative long-chain-fatty-acid--CoA ligase [Prochlorococcus marinus str. MIT 9515]|uniref:Putative long-chain-fatty-acid--CoA ligase n=1 Tax=Prochlorococcus marinus (strain MIT 9515) TaxID=167542 RepID=A2BV62_PROM5|nr:AMP-binding protein [Prochlorococcus marinus]ABM71673.1 putative long-chain-fatty-acid--CoA ligase [Prochlorococcus marinus str. MIT 9515]
MNELAYWPASKSHPKNEKFIRERKYINNLVHVDQIWEYLKFKCGDTLAINDLRGKNKEKYSYSELANLITKVSLSFKTYGLVKGDVVTVISENSPRWLIADQGLMRLGAINAVRGINSPSVELEYIIDHSKSVGLIVQSKEVWLKLNEKEKLKKRFKFIINLEDEQFEDLINWQEFIKVGDKGYFENNSFEKDNNQINDIASILYTSGTTGKPKGVPLTHANFLHQIINLAYIADPETGTSVLSVLPIWHSYERSAEYFFFSCGCTQFYTNPKFLKDDIKKVKPVVMATVPRLWEAIHDGFFLALKKMNPKKQKTIKFLIKNSSIFKRNLRKIRNIEINQVSSLAKICLIISVLGRFFLHKISSTFLWPSILKQLCGEKLKFPINGGGALPEHVDLFFESLGIDVLVGYGLTETSPVLTCRRRELNVRGSSGQPLAFTEIKIVNEEKDKILEFREVGKILVKGPQVMKGYLNNDSATKDVLSKDGWFDTGDLGFLIPNGSLVITGRAKDTIVLSSGENIEPNPLETQILSSEFINQVQLVGQDKKFLTALVVPNIELVKNKFFANDLSTLNSNKNIGLFFKSEINSLLKKRLGARFEEQILDCYFVDAFTLENGLLTQTLKQKRREIVDMYSSKIEDMYKK